MNPDALQKRVIELIDNSESKRETLEGCIEIYTGTISVLSTIYGPDSNQVTTVKIPAEEAYKGTPGRIFNTFSSAVVQIAVGALKNLKQELNLGLIGSLRQRMTGEVIADLVQLARNQLLEQGDAAKDVASVLAAASFEAVIRKMGSTVAGTVGGEKLADVLTALKDKGILTGPQLTTAQGYLTFRNKALHAEWNTIDRPTVSSVLAFVEQLVLKYFQ